MADLVARYVRHMERRGLADNTIGARTRVLRRYEAEVGWVADKEAVEDWLDGPCAKSRATYLSHLQCFFRWACAEGCLEVDPTQKVQPPKLRRNLPRPIPDPALQKALKSANPLMKAWLLLAAYQGMRAQEIAGLRVEDVDGVAGLLRVVEAKGGRERMLPLHPAVRRALEALPLPIEGYAFRKSDGSRATPGMVAHAMGAYLHRLGIQSTPHSLRHWFGTGIYRGTKDLRLTQELMGHASPSTTAVYAAWDRAGAARAVGSLSC
jgi:integrase/recombinase XerC